MGDAAAQTGAKPGNRSRRRDSNAATAPGKSSPDIVRPQLRGLNVLASSAGHEKEKVSITLDKPLVDEIRAHFAGQPLSASINQLLYSAVAQAKLGVLVDELEQESGPASPQAYERVLAQWFDEI
jgi:hypothetical protein